MQDLVTTAQAAEMIGVDVSTVNRWAAEGKLVAVVRLPHERGARWYRREDIDAICTARKALDAEAVA